MKNKIIQELNKIKFLNNHIDFYDEISSLIEEQSTLPLAYQQQTSTPSQNNLLSPDNAIIKQVQADTENRNKTPGFVIDPCTDSSTDEDGDKTTDYDYNQAVSVRATVFNDSQDIMECWDCQIFTSASNAANSMYIPGKIIYQDPEYGYFFYGDDKSTVRVYLPKDEFFTQYTNKVKSITAYKTCKDACAKQNGETYTLVYNLKDPSKAIFTLVMTESGPVLSTDDTINRGWELNYSIVKDTGYFSMGGQNVDPANVSGLDASKITELSLANYSEDYARSPFDKLYDSGLGTIAMIVGAVVVSVISEGTLAPAMIGWIESQAARTILTTVISLTTEYALAIPEIMYLQSRGKDSDAIFVAILAHVPLFQYAWLNKAFKIDSDIVYGQTTELLNKYRRGVYKTPADMKNHLKQLAKTNPELAKYLKEILEAVGENIVKNPDLLKKSFANEIKNIIKNVDAGKLKRVEKAWQRVQRVENLVPRGSGELVKTAKVFGVVMIPAMGVNYGLTEIIGENPLVRDPYRLGKITTALENLNQIITNSDDVKRLTTLIENTKKKCNQAINDENYPLLVEGATESLMLFEDMDMILTKTIKLKADGSATMDGLKKNISSPFVSMMLGVLITQAQKEAEASYAAGKANDSKTSNLVRQYKIVNMFQEPNKFTCEAIVLDTNTNPPKTKQDSCTFRNWVIQYYPSFTFQKPKRTNPDRRADLVLNKLSACSYWEKNNKDYRDDFYLNECGYKLAWEQYGKNYRDSKGGKPLASASVPKINTDIKQPVKDYTSLPQVKPIQSNKFGK
jgi:hypothetical protein